MCLSETHEFLTVINISQMVSMAITDHTKLLSPNNPQPTILLEIQQLLQLRPTLYKANQGTATFSSSEFHGHSQVKLCLSGVSVHVYTASGSEPPSLSPQTCVSGASLVL